MKETKNKYDNLIEIRCPRCLKNNKINLSKELTCQRCKKKLSNNRYIKPIIKGVTAITTAGVIGLGGGVALDEYFETNRYPISVEYSLINSCISADELPLRFDSYKSKRIICECALEKTEELIDYADYKKNQLKFLDEFEKQAKDCK